MNPYYTDDTITLHHGDCLDILRQLSDASVDAIITDPPYGLGFMGKAWDDLPPGVEWAEECLRVLKPGGHLLAFGGSRTWHRLAVAVEDAGFEIRDSIAWLYGSGFPKSLDVSKAIDKAAGAAPESPNAGKWNPQHNTGSRSNWGETQRHDWEAATPEAERWQGWGTALKPAFEPIVIGRKPLAGTVAANVLAHGTGALNIDASRVASDEVGTPRGERRADEAAWRFKGGSSGSGATSSAGRWPANVVLDESQAAELDEQSGTSTSRVGKPRGAAAGDGWGMTATGAEYNDQGGASRFFPTFRYQAKAPKRERPVVDGVAHATVKPLELMRWLVRLVTPPGGVVLEPFAGSGATVEACLLEGFRCIAIEREAEYLPLINLRVFRSRELDS
jgi:site-specific DNA-methyltransferase (adenine-specific)